MSDIELKQQIREQLWQANYQAIGRSALSLEQRAQVGEIIELRREDLVRGGKDGRRYRLPREVLQRLLQRFGRPPGVMVVVCSLRRDEQEEDANARWLSDPEGWKETYFEPLKHARQHVAIAARQRRPSRGSQDPRCPLIGRSYRSGIYTVEVWVEAYDAEEIKPYGQRRRARWETFYLNATLSEWLGTFYPDAYEKLSTGVAAQEMAAIAAEAAQALRVEAPAVTPAVVEQALTLREAWLSTHPAAPAPETPKGGEA